MKILTVFDLKIIALFTMVTDHLGAIFFPEYHILRIIGRVAFVLYAFMLVEGIFHTKNKEKHLLKLFFWGLISEIPYDWALYYEFWYWEKQNIFWTLFLSSLGIVIMEKFPNFFLRILVVVATMSLAKILRFSYDWSGVLLIYSFYGAKKIKWNPAILSQTAIIGIAIIRTKFYLYALLGTFPILFYNGKEGRKTGSIYYSFYAVHLFLFAVVRSILARMG